MVCSSPALSHSRSTAKKEDLLKLLSEVLQLSLQALKLPIMRSIAQFAAGLATALFGNPSKAVTYGQKQSSRVKKATTRHRRSTSNAVHTRANSDSRVQTSPNTSTPVHEQDIVDSA